MAATLIVEDGSRVEGANVYTTMEESNAYHQTLGNTEWASASVTEEQRITAKIRAAQYVDLKYADQWPGKRAGGRTQSMQWPRESAYDRSGDLIRKNEIPAELKQAIFEAEIRELKSPGSLLPDVTGTARVLMERVGDLQVQYADDGARDAAIPRIPAIENLLAPLLGRAGTTRTGFVRRA